MINFIMGFASGLLFFLIALFAIAWNNVQEKKRNNSSNFDWEKGEYSIDIEDSDDKKKIKLN